MSYLPGGVLEVPPPGINFYPRGVLEVPLETRRAFNPDYWDGVVLGENPELGPSSPVADAASRKFALRALKACLAPGYRGETLEDGLYLPASTFDPNDHTPGTVVMYHQESLYRADADFPHIDPNIFRGRVALKHPTELERDLGNKALISFEARTLEGAGLVFQEAVRYGVIPPLYGRKRSRLVTIPSSCVKPTPRQQASTLDHGGVCRVVIDKDITLVEKDDGTKRRAKKLDFAKLKVERGAIPIGQVRHFAREEADDPDNPRLVRVTQLEVLAFGRS